MKQKLKSISIFLLGTLAIVQLGSCKKDKDLVPLPQPVNEPELITKVVLQFTDSANSSITYSATFSDPDGDGGNAPVQFDSILLPANRTFNCNILLLNETQSPAKDMAKEIEEEGYEHLFVFTPTGAGVNIIITDADKNGLPLGLKSKWRTGNTSSGTVKVVLKHQTDGIKDGSPNKGDTDIELDFKTRITN
jgi:hypothetical protein